MENYVNEHPEVAEELNNFGLENTLPMVVAESVILHMLATIEGVTRDDTTGLIMKMSAVIAASERLKLIFNITTEDMKQIMNSVSSKGSIF